MLNRQLLFDLSAIRYILPHVDHAELNIRRFALKALAQLCQLPQAPEVVLENPQNLRKIALMLAKVRSDVRFFNHLIGNFYRDAKDICQILSCSISNNLFVFTRYPVVFIIS